MGFLIYISLIVSGLLFQKSKLISALICIFMWIVFAYGTNSSDSGNYQYVYENILNSSLQKHYEPGFSILMMFSNKVGLTFLQFRMLLASIYVLIIYKSINNYSKYASLVLALFIIAPFFFFVSGLRNAISSAIIIYSIKYLYKDNRKAKIKYLIGLLFATMFHYSSVFYIVFLLINKNKKMNLLKSRRGLFILMLMVFSAVIVQLPEIAHYLIQLVTNNTKILYWFSNQITTTSIFGALLFSFIFILSVIYSTVSKNTMLNFSKSNNAYTLENASFSITVNQIFYYLIIWMPFMMINVTYLRLLMGVFPLLLCSYINSSKITIDNSNINQVKFKSTEFGFIIYVIFLGIFNGFIYYSGSGFSYLDLLAIFNFN